MRSPIDLLRADRTAYLRVAENTKGYFEFKSLDSLSSEEIAKAQTDKALVLFGGWGIGVIRDFALEHELTQGQRIKTVSRHGMKREWPVKYLSNPEVQLLMDVVSAFIKQIPIKARRGAERRISIIKLSDKK